MHGFDGSLPEKRFQRDEEQSSEREPKYLVWIAINRPRFQRQPIRSNSRVQIKRSKRRRSKTPGVSSLYITRSKRRRFFRVKRLPKSWRSPPHVDQRAHAVQERKEARTRTQPTKKPQNTRSTNHAGPHAPKIASCTNKIATHVNKIFTVSLQPPDKSTHQDPNLIHASPSDKLVCHDQTSGETWRQNLHGKQGFWYFSLLPAVVQIESTC